MKSTNLGNVAIANQGVKKSPFPRNRNVYTSCGFGEVQPLQVLHCDADTDSKFSIESKMYLEPIVAPTYGHCKCEFWSYFVEYSDLIDRFKEIFSETPKSTNFISGSTFPTSVPNTLPWMYRSLLSTLMLWGSFLTVYKVVPSSDGTRTYTALVLDDNSQTTDVANELQALVTLLNNNIQTLYGAANTVKALDLSTSQNVFGTYGLTIDARTIIDCPTFVDSNVNSTTRSRNKFTIPLANPDMYTLVDYRPSDTFQLNINTRGVDITPVSIRGADVLIERPFKDSSNNSVYYAFAFRLTAFGKRIYKVFKGAGFQEDFYSYNKKVSLMPIFAVYKAYYECFGLLAYTNYESTSLAKLLFTYSSNGALNSAGSDFNQALGNSSTLTYTGSSIRTPDPDTFKQFVLDLGSMWVTDSQDFVSAQENSVSNAPRPDGGVALRGIFNDFTDSGRSAGTPIQVPSITNPETYGINKGNNQHLYIDDVIHSQLDSEILKKMYQLINVETIAGKRVEQLLRAQGYGEWVDHCKARFIAHDEFAVEFSQVTSLSDTLNPATKNGMILGERGGRGEAYNMGRTHKYKNDESGFLVTLMAVVPDAGYTNTLNPAFDAITKYDFYTPVFDGVGKELLEVNQVVGEMPTCLVDVTDSDLTVNKTDKSFGFSPRGSKWKVSHNIRNGVFALRSVRDSYLPYILDKVIKMGDVVDTARKDDTGTWASTTSVKLLSVDALQYFPQKQLPLAGLAWRYPTRYPWIGMFSRIFAMVGDSVDAGTLLGRLGPHLQSYEFLNSELDGFDILNTVRMTTYEHKLPITDSYETLDEGNEGKIDTNISKA